MLLLLLLLLLAAAAYCCCCCCCLCFCCCRALADGSWQEAAQEFTEALSLDPKHKSYNLQLHFGLCQARKALKQHSEAVASCSAVLELEPGHAGAAQQLVRSLIDMEQWQEAVNKAKELVQRHQGVGEFHEVGARVTRVTEWCWQRHWVACGRGRVAAKGLCAGGVQQTDAHVVPC
jgi:tetratricopeptide (TPR) repeat protein